MNHFAKLSAVFVATASVSNADIVGLATLDLVSSYTGNTSVRLYLNDDGTTTFLDGSTELEGSPEGEELFTFATESEWETLNWFTDPNGGTTLQFAMKYQGIQGLPESAHLTVGAIVNTITLDSDGTVIQGDWYDYEYEYDFPGTWTGTGSITAIPAPGALALIGLAGFGRRRRGSC